MSASSSIADVVRVLASPIERDEANSGFRRTIEIHDRQGIEYTIVITSDDRRHLEIVVPIH